MDTRLSRVFNNFIRDFSNYESLLPTFFPTNFSSDLKTLPRMDVSETDKEYLIEADLPGVKKDDLDISVTKDRNLIIKGKRESKKEQKDRNYYCLERSFGSFERSMALPSDANEDALNASFADGIITIKIPKKELSNKEVKKIEVSTK